MWTGEFFSVSLAKNQTPIDQDFDLVPRLRSARTSSSLSSKPSFGRLKLKAWLGQCAQCGNVWNPKKGPKTSESRHFENGTSALQSASQAEKNLTRHHKTQSKLFLQPLLQFVWGEVLQASERKRVIGLSARCGSPRTATLLIPWNLEPDHLQRASGPIKYVSMQCRDPTISFLMLVWLVVYQLVVLLCCLSSFLVPVPVLSLGLDREKSGRQGTLVSIV